MHESTVEIVGQRPTYVRIPVRYTGGAYVARCSGTASSATESEVAAVRRVARKVYGRAVCNVIAPEPTDAESAWLVEVDADRVAWCWATGRIEIGQVVPSGAIEIARGPSRCLMEWLEATAESGSGLTEGAMLVPGLIKAVATQPDVDAIDALQSWLTDVASEARVCLTIKGLDA